MSFTPDEVAIEFLQWPPRLDAGVGRWPGARTRADLFANYLRRQLPTQNAEDVKTAAAVFAGRATTLPDWYGLVLEPYEDALFFRDGAPYLSVGALSRWRALTARLDGDALVAWRIARDAPPGTSALKLVDRMPRWGTYLTVHDRGLAQVLERGLADSHVHIEACDPLPLLWLRVMAGEVIVEGLPSYSAKAIDALADDPDSHQRRRRESRLVRDAIATRRHLEGCLSGIDRLGPRPLEARGAARSERSLLVAGWLAVRFDGTSEDPAGEPSLATHLDRYLAAKSAFLQRHLQAHGAGLGLMRFREFLDRGETLHEQRIKKRSPRVRHERYKRMLAHASEAPSLVKLELRVAPFKTVKEWAQFGKLWEDRFAGRPPFDRVQAAFVVHFIRNAEAGNGVSARMHFGRLRERLDRLTAVFQSFRHRHPDLARHVVGMDVANVERGCPPEIFVPYLRMLRGNGKKLSRGSAHPAFACWARLAEGGKDLPPPGLGSLGLTYHAGEDFHHPLDGLRAIAGLLDNVLEPGDRIGHGLAAGWDVDRFERMRRLGPVPQGILLDNLTWLRRQAQADGAWSGRETLAADRVIIELSRRIYGSHPPGHELDRALDLRFEMPDRAWAGMTTAHGLVHRETFDHRTISARAAFAPREEVAAMAALSSEVGRAQVRVIKAIRSRGVSVEANPSSNLATGTIDRLPEHPYFRFDQALEGKALTSFNTDDPGLFGTRTDIEYAMMFEAMLDRDIDRSSALEMIDRARQQGVDQSFV